MGTSIRPAVRADLGFVLNSWLRSFSQSKWSGSLPNNVYWDAYHKALVEILGRPDTKVLVATSPDDSAQIIGYVAFCSDAVHYVYVKQMFRRLGVGADLLKAALGSEVHFRYTFKPNTLYLPKGYYASYCPKIVKAKPTQRPADAPARGSRDEQGSRYEPSVQDR